MEEMYSYADTAREITVHRTFVDKWIEERCEKCFEEGLPWYLD